MRWIHHQQLFLVPTNWVYKWYILPIGGLYGTYHLLREPRNSIDITKNFRYLKWRNPHLYKLYGYKGYVREDIPTIKIAENKVQDSSMLGT